MQVRCTKSLVRTASRWWGEVVVQSAPDGCLQQRCRHHCAAAGNYGHQRHVWVLLRTTRLQPDAAHCSLAAALLRVGARRQGLPAATTLACTACRHAAVSEPDSYTYGCQWHRCSCAPVDCKEQPYAAHTYCKTLGCIAAGCMQQCWCAAGYVPHSCYGFQWQRLLRSANCRQQARKGRWSAQQQWLLTSSSHSQPMCAHQMPS